MTHLSHSALSAALLHRPQLELGGHLGLILTRHGSAIIGITCQLLPIFFSGQMGGIYRAPGEIGSVFCTTSHSARNLHISPAHVPLRKPTICTPFGPVQCHVPISAWDCHEQLPTRYEGPVLPMCIFACFTPHHQPERSQKNTAAAISPPPRAHLTTFYNWARPHHQISTPKSVNFYWDPLLRGFGVKMATLGSYYPM